jgi:hypothetical protein
VWNAPDTCPATYVHERIIRLLGSATPSQGDKPVSATAEVTRAAGGWRVRLKTEREGVAGERSFHTGSCLELAHATALVLALLVNPERVAIDHPAIPSPPLPAVARVETPPAPPAVAAELPRQRALASVAIDGTMDIGTMPRAAGGLALALGVVFGRLHLEGTASGAPDRDVSLRPDGVGARLRKRSAGGRACLALVTGALEAAACAGAEHSFLHATSFGVRFPGDGSVNWTELLAGGGLRWAIASPFGVRLDGFAGFPLKRPDLLIIAIGPVHTIPAVTARVGLGFDIRF